MKRALLPANMDILSRQLVNSPGGDFSFKKSVDIRKQTLSVLRQQYASMRLTAIRNVIRKREPYPPAGYAFPQPSFASKSLVKSASGFPFLPVISNSLCRKKDR